MAPGTARNAASRNAFSPQPSNFEGTLSHHDEPPGPPGIAVMSLSRNDSSTAFFSHWLTFQVPSAALGDAGRALVEQIERVVDAFADFALGRGIDGVPRLKGDVDGGFQGG